MVKYKRKSKINKTSGMAIMLVAVLLSMSIGYCVWTDSQIIMGNINVNYVEHLVFITDSDGDYVSKTEEHDSPAANNAFSFVNSSVTTTNAKNIDLKAEYNDAGWIVIGRDVILTSNFRNDFEFAITGGTYSEIENTIGYNYTVTIPEIVEPGETATITTNIRVDGSHNIRTGKIVYKIAYTAGETTKNVIYTINVV